MSGGASGMQFKGLYQLTSYSVQDVVEVDAATATTTGAAQGVWVCVVAAGAGNKPTYPLPNPIYWRFLRLGIITVTACINGVSKNVDIEGFISP